MIMKSGINRKVNQSSGSVMTDKWNPTKAKRIHLLVRFLCLLVIVCRQLHILIFISPLSYPLHNILCFIHRARPGSLDETSQMRNGA